MCRHTHTYACIDVGRWDVEEAQGGPKYAWLHGGMLVPITNVHRHARTHVCGGDKQECVIRNNISMAIAKCESTCLEAWTSKNSCSAAGRARMGDRTLFSGPTQACLQHIPYIPVYTHV